MVLFLGKVSKTLSAMHARRRCLVMVKIRELEAEVFSTDAQQPLR